jgi:hypothetical protein
MRNYTYVIGPDPYNNVQRWRQKGNGKWSCEAPNVQKAMETIFGSMQFPAELTGRYAFVPGVSLDNMCAHEVVQVWTENPAEIEESVKFEATQKEWPHFGGSEHVGIACEVSVYQLDQYMIPQRLLLAQGSEKPVQTSAVGVAVADYHRNKLSMQVAMQDAKWSVSVAKWDMENKRRQLNVQLRQMEHQIFLADTYMRGTDNIRQLSEGCRGQGPYHVFQQRQFLNKEIALIANMEDFDCKQLEKLEEWIIKNKAWKKMLPFDRCILVTRLRDKSKDYGCPFTNWILNEQNLMSIIWIRDGENVWRILSEVDFDNAVLSDNHEEKRLTDIVTEHIFKTHFQARNEDWRGDPVTPEPEGAIRKTAVKERTEVYKPVSKMPRRFDTLEEWLASEDYTTKIATEIGHAVAERLGKINKKRLVFAIFIQGVIDNTTILDIPKGTNIFEWNLASNFFHLHTDYSHGLPDGQARDEWKAFSDRMFLHPGEVIIVNDRDIVYDGDRYFRPSGNLTSLRFYNVLKMVDGCPMIAYYPLSKHYPYHSVKTPKRVVLHWQVPFIKASMPTNLADRLIEDRDWKENNLMWVPVLAQWRLVQAQWKVLRNNATFVRLKGASED